MRILKAMLILLLLLSTRIYSQVKLEWVARYNGPSKLSEYVSAMALDSSGNLYVTGRDQEDPPGFVTLKINSNGRILWARRYLGTKPITAGPKQIAVDLHGNVYVGAYDVEYIVIKYDSNGVEQWVKRYSGSGSGLNVLNDAALDDKNFGVIVTGIAPFANEPNGCLTINCSQTTGDTLWYRKYNQTWTQAWAMDFGIHIGVAGDSRVILFSSMDILTLSYDLSGNLRWAQTWDGPVHGHDAAADVATDRSGNTYVTGAGTMDSLNDQDAVTIKYDSIGNQQWARTYDGVGDPFNYSVGLFIKTDLYGNIIVAGWQTIHDYDYLTIKYDSLGNQLWARGYNGAANREDFLKGLAVDKCGDVYVTGTTKDIDVYPYPYKMTTIKYNKDGNQIWLQKYPDYDTISSPTAIIIDKDLNVYIAGEISMGPSDIIVLKYSQPPTSVEPISHEVPETFALYQNYPNPFNPKTRIRFTLQGSGFTSLKVYDVFGREVAVLVNEKKEAGEHEVEWNPSTSSGQVLPSGVYYYRIISGTYTETRKALLLR